MKLVFGNYIYYIYIHIYVMCQDSGVGTLVPVKGDCYKTTDDEIDAWELCLKWSNPLLLKLLLCLCNVSLYKDKEMQHTFGTFGGLILKNAKLTIVEGFN